MISLSMVPSYFLMFQPRLQASPLEELEDKTGTQKEKPKRGTGLRSDSLEPTKHFSQVAVELGIDTEQLEYIDISYEVKLLLAQNFNRWLKGENVRHMDFSAKRFPFLPQAILALSSDVHGLNFRDNCLVELPPDFGHLRNLTTLDLSYNSLRNSDSLTNSFRSLTRIRHLFLSANSITHLPPTICLVCLPSSPLPSCFHFSSVSLLTMLLKKKKKDDEARGP